MNWAELFLFILIGFAAQIIDGTLGMAYGVSCRTFLKTVAGLPTALASAVVHVAEVPTTLVSGLSHLRLRNVDRSLLWRLMLPGVVGGVLGAWFLTSIGDQLEPFIDLYLVVMGVIILLKAFRRERTQPRKVGRYIYPLGMAGGFLDATGGRRMGACGHLHHGGHRPRREKNHRHGQYGGVYRHRGGDHCLCRAAGRLSPLLADHPGSCDRRRMRRPAGGLDLQEDPRAAPAGHRGLPDCRPEPI